MNQRKRRLGRGVAVVGAGMSKFGVRQGFNTRDLFAEAYLEMKKTVDKGFDPRDVDAVYIGNAGAEFWEMQGTIGTFMADVAGLTPAPAMKVEDACASGGVSVRQGILAIASGLCDVVITGGVEKMNSMPTDWNTTALASFSDTLSEALAGFSFPSLYATMATVHMHKYGTQHDDLLAIAIKNHENGALNPKAQFTQTIKDMMLARIAKAKERGEPVPTWQTDMDYLHDPRANPVIAWPNTLFDCCPVTDGAAAIMLVSENIAKQFTDHPIYIIGTGQASGYDLQDRETLTSIPSAKLAAKQAYDMAGVKPSDIQIAEVHDCFTIAEAMAIADLGFFKEGREAARAAAEGLTARDGKMPINTSGGLKCKGHPIGASGVGMVVEIFEQMRGHAGPRQVKKDVKLALTHNVGTHGTTTVVNIFERRD